MRNRLVYQTVNATTMNSLCKYLHPTYQVLSRRSSSFSHRVCSATNIHSYPALPWQKIDRRAFKVGAALRADSANFKVDVENNGKKLKVVWPGGESAAFHAVWLRHNCQCPVCLAASNQKSIDPSDIDPSVTVSPNSVSGDSLHLKWSCGHNGSIKTDWLQRNQYPDFSKMMANDTTPTTAMELPRVDGSNLFNDDKVLWSWLKNLNEYGACLLTNLTTQLGTITKVANMFYTVQPTIYGETLVDIITEKDSINAANTCDELHFHMDQIYYESPPGLLLLHCIRNDSSVEGGVSSFLDMVPVVEELRVTHPQHFEVLTRVPATFQMIHYERNKPVEFTSRRPHIVLDKSGKVTVVNWTAGQEGPLAVPEEDVLPYYEAYHYLYAMMESSKYKIYHSLQPGEALTFNNRRMVHSRTRFKLNGGVRHLQKVYVNIDDFRSKLKVLRNKLGHQDYPVKRVYSFQSIWSQNTE